MQGQPTKSRGIAIGAREARRTLECKNFGIRFFAIHCHRGPHQSATSASMSQPRAQPQTRSRAGTRCFTSNSTSLSPLASGSRCSREPPSVSTRGGLARPWKGAERQAAGGRTEALRPLVSRSRVNMEMPQHRCVFVCAGAASDSDRSPACTVRCTGRKRLL